MIGTESTALRVGREGRRTHLPHLHDRGKSMDEALSERDEHLIDCLFVFRTCNNNQAASFVVYESGGKELTVNKLKTLGRG